MITLKLAYQISTKLITTIETFILIVITFAFWYPSPIRDTWLWLLLLLLPIYGARAYLHGRLWRRTPFDLWLAAFVALCVLNIIIANIDPASPPYTRGIIMLGRVLFGIALVLYAVEYGQTHQRLDRLLLATTLGALLLGFLSLASTAWVGKSGVLDVITARLGTTDYLPQAVSTFNPNEIAGALAWVVPLMGGMALYRWQHGLRAWGMTAAFCLALSGLFLGQSRFALFGVFAALTGIAWFLTVNVRWRYSLLAALSMGVLLEAGIVLNVFDGAGATIETSDSIGLSGRDVSSFNKRFALWESGLLIIRDYPLTGVGLNMYRDARVRNVYPTPGFPNAPHAHNEWIQIGADLGIPGLVVFAGLHVSVVRVLWRGWRRGDAAAKALAFSVAGGLTAHLIFGIGDAIPLWDRLSFIFWWLLGLAGAWHLFLDEKEK